MLVKDEKIGKNSMYYKLSICIPNYNRLEKLRLLLAEIVGQITQDSLEFDVEICISDDCSEINPVNIIQDIKKKFPKIAIVYTRNKKNMGMDYNFLNCVLISHGHYSWIIGNDDVPTEGALYKMVELLSKSEWQDVDIIVTPFDSFDYNNNYVRTVYPLGDEVGDILFDTAYEGQLHKLIMKAEDNSALFGFLSNVVFKRSRWIGHGDMFADKMSSIFIQVYMNLQTLEDGAKYFYTPQKIIRNYLDDETNHTIDRAYNIAVGLYDAMDYFFYGEERKHIQKQIVDIFMTSAFMEFLDNDVRKNKIDSLVSEKMTIFRNYYIKKNMRKQFFKDKSVILYGAGCFGKKALEDLMQYEVDIIGICDFDIKKHGSYLKGEIIFGFERLEKEYFQYENCIVVVANHKDLVDIVSFLLEKKINRIAIIT